jgi:hypothetical protein
MLHICLVGRWVVNDGDSAPENDIIVYHDRLPIVDATDYKAEPRLNPHRRSGRYRRLLLPDDPAD